MVVSEQEWARAISALSETRTVALACHLGPDGDALGSMLALGLALRDRGVEVTPSWGSDPFVVPHQYAYAPGQDMLVSPKGYPSVPDLMVTFDAGSFERLGSLEPNARAAKALIVVDHHASNDQFGTINLVDPKAAASAVLVYELLHRLGAPLTQDIATCLYTGLVTDTGRFQYSNTTPDVHKIAGELIAAGAPHVMITDVVYNTHPVGFLKLASTALARLRVHEDANMVWTWITQRDLADTGITMDDVEGLIDLVRTAEGSDVAAVLKEQPEGGYKVSMRSRGASNVGVVCESFGGGGHALAAGFTARNGNPATTIDEIAAALRAK